MTWAAADKLLPLTTGGYLAVQFSSLFGRACSHSYCLQGAQGRCRMRELVVRRQDLGSRSGRSDCGFNLYLHITDGIDLGQQKRNRSTVVFLADSPRETSDMPAKTLHRDG
jgi:hypothetical protein